MSEIITLAQPTCFSCSRIIHNGPGQEVEIRTVGEPHATRVLICSRCDQEIFGPRKEKETNAKKES